LVKSVKSNSIFRFSILALQKSISLYFLKILSSKHFEIIFQPKLLMQSKTVKPISLQENVLLVTNFSD